MNKMENINSGRDLYRRYIIDSILDKAHTYSAFKKIIAIANCGTAMVLFAACIDDIAGKECTYLTSLFVATVIFSIINCILPTTKFFAENLVINNKDIVEIDKLNSIREVKSELDHIRLF